MLVLKLKFLKNQSVESPVSHCPVCDQIFWHYSILNVFTLMCPLYIVFLDGGMTLETNSSMQRCGLPG